MSQERQSKVHLSHVSRIEDRLDEKPNYEEIRKTAIQVGIKHWDLAIPSGLHRTGDLIVVKGQKKQRKTTTAFNIVRNLCKGDRLEGGKVLWETLESGQTQESVKQSLVVMEATAYMAYKVYGAVENLPMTSVGMDRFTNMDVIRDARDPSHSQSGPGNLFKLSVDYARSADRTPLQHEAIQAARKQVDSWPLHIFGATSGEGRTKVLESDNNGGILDDLLPFKRWKFAVEELGVKVIVVDHVNAYHGTNDYEKQNRAVLHISAAVSELGVIMIAIVQPSLQSVRLGGQLSTRGGTRIEEEANTVVSVKYKQDDDKVTLLCDDTRRAPFPDVFVPMEKNSGLFFPFSYLARG